MISVGLSEYKIELPSMMCQILHLLTRGGYQAYAVGGCVRDALRGVDPKDYDICTSALPDAVMKLFRSYGFDVLPTGIQHGTVTVLTDEGSFEVTTFRVDGAYVDGRHPDSVEFTDDLVQDLSRRDFTINAMAYSPSVGLVDPFGGRFDLAMGVIRCVGDPMQRFSEDSLRVLRALRFSAVLGFRLHPTVSAAVHKMADSFMHGVSMERIQTEFSKILVSDRPDVLIQEYFDVFSQVIPELVPLKDCEQNKYHRHPVLEHCLAVMVDVPADLVLRLAALFHDVGKPDSLSVDEDGHRHFYGHPAVSARLVVDILQRLRYPNSVISKVYHLVQFHDAVVPVKNEKLSMDGLYVRARRLLSIHGDLLLSLFRIAKADIADHSEESNPVGRLAYLDALCFAAAEELRGSCCLKIRDLAVSGRDVMACGVPEGPAVGTVLNALLEYVLEDPVRNERSILLEFIQTFVAKQFPAGESLE